MQSGLKILLIDDDRDFIREVSRQLETKFHHETVVLHNAMEATRTLKTMNTGIDLILVDYEMPSVDGLEFLQWMKQHHLQTPVVMLTAAGSEAVAIEAVKLGAYDFVRKEQLDFDHLGLVINATHERHLFRVGQEFEEERLREMDLNRQATDKARDVLNTITPPLNTAIANINYELEVKSEELLEALSPDARGKVRRLVDEVLKEMRMLEMSVRGLLTLYRILQAHHAEEEDIEGIRKDLERELQSKPRS
jgi:DNA-binding response OmpR family regulator